MKPRAAQISVDPTGLTVVTSDTVQEALAELDAAAGGASYTDEQARDAIGAALVAGSGISVTVNDPGDTITIATAATTGAEGVLPLDVVPGSAHAKDDEFDGSSLNGKWTAPWTSASGMGVTTTVGNGRLLVEPSASGSGLTKRGGYGIRQAAPSGSFSVMAKVSNGMPTGDQARVGLCVGRSASSVATVLGSNHTQSWWAEFIGVSGYSLTAEWGGFDGTQTTKSGAPTFTWYKFTYDAGTSTLKGYVSYTGIAWTLIRTLTSYSQPTEIGLVLWSHEAANVADDHILSCEWFRVTEP